MNRYAIGLTGLIGMLVGYVLGTHDGRSRYEQVRARALQLWNGSPANDVDAEPASDARDETLEETEATARPQVQL